MQFRETHPARNAFREGDLAASIQYHKRISDEPHKVNIKRNYIKYAETFVENAPWGLFITCSIVAGVGSFQGILDGSLSVLKTETFTTILFFSILMLFSVGFAMAFLDYMNNNEYRAFYAQEKKRETWEYDNYIEGEQREMIELYIQKGIPRKEAEKVIRLLSGHRSFFIDMMMKEELELLPPNDFNFILNAIVILLSVAISGIIPLIPLLLIRFEKNWERYLFCSMEQILPLSLGLGLILLFICGFSKSKFSVSDWWVLGGRMVIGGIVVCGIAAGIGSNSKHYLKL